MPKRRRGDTLERWEVALVKAMLARGGINDQDILAYFTRQRCGADAQPASPMPLRRCHQARQWCGPVPDITP